MMKTEPSEITFGAADFAARVATSGFFFLLGGSSSLSFFPLTSRVLFAGLPGAAGVAGAEALMADYSTIKMYILKNKTRRTDVLTVSAIKYRDTARVPVKPLGGIGQFLRLEPSTYKTRLFIQDNMN